MTDREDEPPANFFRQNATEGHNHHYGCGRGAAPQSPEPVTAFPSEHLTPSFVYGFYCASIEWNSKQVPDPGW